MGQKMKKVHNDDIDKFQDYGLYVPTRTIYFGSESYSDEGVEGGVDGLLAERFIKNLLILDGISSEPIAIIENCIGGDEYHGMAMYDAINSCRSKITVKVFGHAMSMGSIILQAADVRIMSPNARQMLHYGTWECGGHAKTSQKWAQEGAKFDVWMEKLYLQRIREKHPKYTQQDVINLLNHDTFLTAQESVKLGLADKII